MRLIRVHFNCEWRDGSGRQHFARHDFQLGLGPCGKSVAELQGEFDLAGYSLKQLHTDGTFKRFHYPAATILGRIEEEYALDIG